MTARPDAERSDSLSDPADDGALILLAGRGDQDAFASLVRRYQRLVFRIAGGFLRDRGEVEDIAQETFLRAFQALGRFRPGARFGPWIGRIAVNLCYDRLRQRRGRFDTSWDELPPAEQEEVGRMAGGAAADESMAARELAGRLLQALPARDRQVLVLVDALGYTPAEAAELAGCSPLLLRVRLHRARGRARGLAARLLPERGKGWQP